MLRLFNAALEYIQRNQPVSFTGAVVHSAGWIRATRSDILIRNPSYIPDATRRTVAVYCIHGTSDMNSSFITLVQRMIQQQLPTDISEIHLVAFSERIVSIDNYATQLLAKIQANHHTDVILMGHSRGGLVASYFAENCASTAGIHVHGVFNICTPFRGSHLAIPPLTWFSASVEQMRLNSVFLRNLTAQMSASTVPYFYYGAANDSIVNPDDCCPVGAYVHIYDRHAHLSVMTSHRLVQSILFHFHNLMMYNALLPVATSTTSLGLSATD